MNKIFIIIIFLFFFIISYLVHKIVSSGSFLIKNSLFDNDKWITYSDILPDGSCFYHSVLFAISKSYRESDNKTRVTMANDMRKVLYDYTTYDLWKKSYSGFCTYDKLKHNLLYEWAGNVEWKVMSDYLGIQIIILRDIDKSLYWGFDAENGAQPTKKVILILNKNDNHFEPILYDKKYKYQYTFHLSESLYNILKKNQM